MMKEYIIENYCVNKDKPLLQCNGLCHLGEQVKKMQEEESTGDPKTTLNAEDFPYSIIPSDLADDDLYEDSDDVQLSFDNNLYSYLYSESGFHPPEFI